MSSIGVVLDACVLYDFLIRQFDQSRETIVQLIIEQASILRNPPQTPLEVLNTLEQFVPNFVSLVRKELTKQ